MKPLSIRYLVLWLTTACNLQCMYCYRKNEGEARAMPEGIAMKALSLAAASGRPFHVQLAGGEPTLETGLIRFVGQTVREAGWPATIALQTNGTLVDASLIDLCLQYDIGIGVSIDGPPALQERIRGKAAATLRGLALLEEAAVPVSVTTVLSALNAERLEELVLTVGRFANVRSIGLDPVVLAGAGQAITGLCPSAEAIRSGILSMQEAMKLIRRYYGGRIGWREGDAVHRALWGSGPVRPYCHALRGESLAVHPDGTVYPCGQTVGDPGMAAGTVDSVDGAFLANCYRGIQLRGDCGTCPLDGCCPGDCPSRLSYNNGAGISAMCVIYRTIAETFDGKPVARRVS